MTIPFELYVLIVNIGVLTIYSSCCAVMLGVWYVYRNSAVRLLLALFAGGIATNVLSLGMAILSMRRAPELTISIAQHGFVVVAVLQVSMLPELMRRCAGAPPQPIRVPYIAASVGVGLVVAVALAAWVRTRSFGAEIWASEIYRSCLAVAYIGGGGYLLYKRPPAGIERRVITLLAVALLVASSRMVVVAVFYVAGIAAATIGAQATVLLLSMLVTLLTGGLAISAALLLEVQGIERTSERLRLAREAAASASFGRLAAGLAHDFANVMQLVSLSTHTLAASTADREARLLKQVADVARTRMKRLMEFARVVPAAVRAVHVSVLLTRITPLLRQLISTHQLSLQGISDGIVVMCDPEAVERAVVDLVRNAVEWSPPGSTITVRLHRDVIRWRRESGEGMPDDLPAGAYAHLVVADNGSGIAPDDLPHLFDPAFTRHQGRTTGLGLPMARASTRAAGGDIQVVSSLGKGTQAHLWLPLAPR